MSANWNRYRASSHVLSMTSAYVFYTTLVSVPTTWYASCTGCQYPAAWHSRSPSYVLWLTGCVSLKYLSSLLKPYTPRRQLKSSAFDQLTRDRTLLRHLDDFFYCRAANLDYHLPLDHSLSRGHNLSLGHRIPLGHHLVRSLHQIFPLITISRCFLSLSAFTSRLPSLSIDSHLSLYHHYRERWLL